MYREPLRRGSLGTRQIEKATLLVAFRRSQARRRSRSAWIPVRRIGPRVGSTWDLAVPVRAPVWPPLLPSPLPCFHDLVLESSNVHGILPSLCACRCIPIIRI
jgi:hypothetical protein